MLIIGIIFIILIVVGIVLVITQNVLGDEERRIEKVQAPIGLIATILAVLFIIIFLLSK